MIMGLLEILLKSLQGLSRQEQVLMKIMKMVAFGTTLQGNGVMLITMNNMFKYLETSISQSLRVFTTFSSQLYPSI